MATQVLRPHDVLDGRDSAIGPRRKSGGPRPHRRPEGRKQREGSPRPAKPADARKGATLKQSASAPPLAKSSVEVYAGSGFWKSPAPSSLPLPSFAALKEDAPAVGEYLATMALRRMLRLE